MCLVVALVIIGLLFAGFFLATLGTVLALLPWLIVGLIAGWAASAITESKHGILGDILIGWAGSIIGGVLYTVVTHQRVVGMFSLTHILVAIGGSVILLLIAKAIAGHA